MKKFILFFSLIFVTIAFAATETVETSVRPWNGYWWPFSKGGLLNGSDYNLHPSPMEKYDIAFNTRFLTCKWEEENHYAPDGEPWWGHCNGWAAAAVSEAEPSRKHTYNSVVFYVGDIKGLLTESYQGSSGPIYGTRYNGDDNQAAYEDINPLDFQNLLEMYLKDNDTPILIDADPTVEIWTYPVYKYELNYNDEGNIRHCTLTIYCATDIYDDGTMDPDDFGDPHYFSKTYTYDLTLDSSGTPISGVWTGNSIDDHPDFAWYPENIASSNPYVELSKVKQIISQNYTDDDDQYEPDDDFNSANRIDSNSIHRILNNDFYKFFLEPGEELTLKMYFNDYYSYTFGKLFDSEQNFIDYFTYDNQEKCAFYTFSPVDAVTHYFFEAEYPVIGYYNDNYMIKETLANKYVVIPHTLETFYWDNFVYAGFIPYISVDTVNQTQTEITETIGSVVGVISNTSYDIAANMKFNAGFKEIPITTEQGTAEWLKINTADDRIKLLSFYQSEGDGSMGYFYSIKPSKRFILPHVPAETHYWWYGIVMVNPSHFKSIRIRYKLYDYGGEILKEGYLDLQPYQKLVDLFENIFPQTDMASVSYIEFNCYDNFIVSTLYGTLNHRELAYVPADSDFVKQGETVYITKDLMPKTPNPWGGLVILNPDNELNANVYFNIMDTSGTYYRYTLKINPRQKKVDVLENFLPDGLTLDNVERIEMTISSGYVSVFALFGDHDKGMLASYLPPKTNDGMVTYYLPNITGHSVSTTIFVKNEKTYDNKITLSAVNSNGEIIEEAIYTLSSLELKKFNITEIFQNPDEVKTVMVYSSKFITPFAEVKSEDDRFYEIIGPNFTKDSFEQTSN